LLFLSVVSGRNPAYLFGQPVHAAPLIRRLGLEANSTAYMLVESGRATTPEEVIAAIREVGARPLAVGGGLRTPDEVARSVRAGADLVVGTAVEQRPDAAYIAELAAVVHEAVPRPL